MYSVLYYFSTLLIINLIRSELNGLGSGNEHNWVDAKKLV